MISRWGVGARALVGKKTVLVDGHEVAEKDSMEEGMEGWPSKTCNCGTQGSAFS